MPTEPIETPSKKDETFAFRLEILKKELDFIDNSIRKIDDIGNSIKNWAILAWTGVIAAILGKPELHGYVAFSAVPPLVFMLVDAHWRKIQRRFTYRQAQIANFLNSPDLDKAFETRVLDFELFDPIARKSRRNADFRQHVSVPRILGFPTVSLLYVGLAILSIGLTAFIYLAPPKSAGSNPPGTPLPAATPAPKAGP